MINPEHDSDMDSERPSSRADRVRSRLVSDIDALGGRRRTLVDGVQPLEPNSRLLIPVVAGVAAIGVGAAVLANRRRRQRLALETWLNFGRGEPNSAPIQQKGPWRQMVEKAALALLLTAAKRFAERALTRLLETPSETPRA